MLPCCSEFDTEPFNKKNSVMAHGPCPGPKQDPILAKANAILLDGEFETPEVKEFVAQAHEYNTLHPASDEGYIPDMGGAMGAVTNPAAPESQMIHRHQQPATHSGGDNAGSVAGADPRRANNTLFAAEARGDSSGKALLNERIEVPGKGKGTVVDIAKSLGRATKHVVLFDSGVRETVHLSKDPSNPDAKGAKFYML
eukprot:g7777.t1